MRRDFCFRGDYYIMKKVRVVSLACDMPTGTLIHPKQYGLWPAQDFIFRGGNHLTKKVRLVSLAHKCLLVLLFCRFWFQGR